MHTLTSPNLTLPTDLLTRYQATRQWSEKLCQPLQAEDYVVQPVAFVSPPKWNLAHVSWFFETFVLKSYIPGYQEYNPDFGYFFNSYYESVGQRTLRAHRGNMTRPSTEEVYAYRHYIDTQMTKLLGEMTLPNEALAVIELGIQHEQQHQELLLTDLKYILGHNPLFPVYRPVEGETGPSPAALPKVLFLEVGEGLYQIGYKGQDFCFDNEKGVHRAFLPAFRIADQLVSNAEYLEFMADGGYQDFRHWLSAGWAWVKENKIESPLYWHRREGEWYHYTLAGLKKVNPMAPVTHVSLYEADAFAAWRGKRLPTEFEWEVACQQFNPVIPEAACFLENETYAPRPESRPAVFYGNAWQWTNSAYLPYPHYQKAPGALGEYNGKFMMNQMVLRGGACVTPRSHIRATYRNFFHPDERWQFTGIRLAEYC
ncbi:MAG: ergothioneine biosynthesis protein EgtB [Microscillaceae bacterium]